MKIRYANLNDVRDIVEVYVSCGPDSGVWYKGFGGERREASYEELSLFERMMNGGSWMSVETCAVHINDMLLRGHHPIVAEVDNKVVGEIEVFIGEEYPLFGKDLHISVLYVHPKYQRQGIGSALVRHVINLAEEEGCNCCSVWGGDFYRRFGFEHYFNRKSFKAKTRASEMDYRIEEVTIPDYDLVRGMPMPVGRYACSRLEWERDEIGKLQLPELMNLPFKRMKVSSAHGEAYVILNAFTPFDKCLTARAWSDSMKLEALLEIILSEGNKMGFDAVSLMLKDDDFERVKQTVKPSDGKTHSDYLVKWLRKS